MIEFSLSKNALLPALLTIAGAIDKRQSLVILSNILFEIFPDQLILTATDLELEMSTTLSCQTASEGKLTLPAKKMIDIVRSLDNEVLTIRQTPEGVQLISGRSRFKLATLPAEDYPVGDYTAFDGEFSLPVQGLLQLFQSTHFAMSQQDVRVFLNGLLFELDREAITCVASDGHRMAINKLHGDFSANTSQYLLPRRGVQEIIRLLHALPDETVSISVGKGHFRLKTPQVALVTRLIEAQFPPYRKATPLNNDKFVLVDCELLKRALLRIVILANEKLRTVLLQLQPGSLTLIANNNDQEEASEVVEAHLDGEQLTLGINATYLLDVLHYFPAGLIRLSLSTADQSMLVQSLDNEVYHYIIMPMKI